MDFAYGPITLYGRPFQVLLLSAQIPHRGPATPSRKRDGLGCSPFARHYLGNHGCLLFLRVLRCFTSPGFASRPYVFRPRCPGFTRGGLPHSEISGSKRVCRSPKLIAAYHVLHRLLMPRHSPCALSSLTKITLANSSSVKNCIYPLYAVFKEPPRSFTGKVSCSNIADGSITPCFAEASQGIPSALRASGWWA